MSESSRRERYLKALEIAERHGNKFMAANIRAELRKLDSQLIEAFKQLEDN